MLTNKKIDKKLKKELKKCKKEKIRCAKQYTDWKDDDYNCGPLKFIWGLNTNSAEKSNFRTLNLIYIYYNRDNGLYFLELDGDSNEFNEYYIKELQKIESCFTEWICSNSTMYEEVKNFAFDKDIGTVMNLGKDLFVGKSIAELYYKLRILVKGLEY